jgi:hydrogenase expression/formation protein HypD
MKFIDEFRNAHLAHALINRMKGQIAVRINGNIRQTMRFMEFCGGHTHAIMRFGIRKLLPPEIEMLSGPGCPVCVTSSLDLDRAIAFSQIPGVILATFGDMIRVRGSQGSLQDERARGADVRVVYSPLDALHLAEKHPDRPVIFLGVGFETTAPGVAASILEAEAKGLKNYFVLSLHKLTPPATRAILDAGAMKLSGILGPGHVTTVIGSEAWKFLPEQYGVPIAVTGFEPLDILRGIGILVEQIDKKQKRVDNAYSRSVLPKGNRTALTIMNRVFGIHDAEWRGLGILSKSGLSIREEYASFDASKGFQVNIASSQEPPGCRCGEVLRGLLNPLQCPLFQRVCNFENPVGPCMVSAEGACSAYLQYGEHNLED